MNVPSKFSADFEKLVAETAELTRHEVLATVIMALHQQFGWVPLLTALKTVGQRTCSRSISAGMDHLLRMHKAVAMEDVPPPSPETSA